MASPPRQRRSRQGRDNRRQLIYKPRPTTSGCKKFHSRNPIRLRPQSADTHQNRGNQPGGASPPRNLYPRQTSVDPFKEVLCSTFCDDPLAVTRIYAAVDHWVNHQPELIAGSHRKTAVNPESAPTWEGNKLIQATKTELTTAVPLLATLATMRPRAENNICMCSTRHTYVSNLPFLRTVALPHRPASTPPNSYCEPT